MFQSSEAGLWPIRGPRRRTVTGERRVTSSQRLQESYQDGPFFRRHLRHQTDEFENPCAHALSLPCHVLCSAEKPLDFWTPIQSMERLVGIGEEVSTLPDGTPRHYPAPNPLARVVPRGRGICTSAPSYQSMPISTHLCRIKPCIRQRFGPTLEPCPARKVQLGIVPQDGIAIER